MQITVWAATWSARSRSGSRLTSDLEFAAASNVREIAQRVDPRIRAVCMDNDPVVPNHAGRS